MVPKTDQIVMVTASISDTPTLSYHLVDLEDQRDRTISDGEFPRLWVCEMHLCFAYILL